MKQKSFTLDASPYSRKIRIHVTKSSYKKATKTKDDLDCDGCTDDSADLIQVGIFDNKIETLVHELSHAVIEIFDHIGQPINKDSEEAFAYLLGNLAGKAAKKITKLTQDDNDVDEKR